MHVAAMCIAINNVMLFFGSISHTLLCCLAKHVGRRVVPLVLHATLCELALCWTRKDSNYGLMFKAGFKLGRCVTAIYRDDVGGAD